MQSHTVQLFRMLVEAGARPGEDFSYDMEQGNCHINERGFILLQNAYPAIDWGEVVNVVQRDLDEPARALNEYLGTDFLASLLAMLQARLGQLEPPAAAWYLHQILGGVEQRTGILLYEIVQRDLPPEVAQRIDQLLQVTSLVQSNLWIEDLVLSAGGTPADISYDGPDILLSEAGVHLLNQVWIGELEVQDEQAA